MAASRIGHRWAWRRNALRRRSDRVQAGLTFVMLAMMVLVVPGVAWSVAGRTYRAEVRADDWDRQHHFPVTAELLNDAPGLEELAGKATPAVPSRGTLARWTGPDKSVHIGVVLAGIGFRRGSSVSIWVDAHGALTGPPLRRNPILDAVMAALLTAVVLGSVLYAVRGLVVWRLDRRRLRAWQQEWLVVEPRWTHR